MQLTSHLLSSLSLSGFLSIAFSIRLSLSLILTVLSFFLSLSLLSSSHSLSLSLVLSLSLSTFSISSAFVFQSDQIMVGVTKTGWTRRRLNAPTLKKTNIALFCGIFVKINQEWNDGVGGLQQRFICSTSLPLTSTRWFDQHIQAFHTLRSAVYKSRQHQEWISSEKFVRMGMPRIEPGAAGSEAWTLPLCYAFLLLFVSTISIHEWDALVDCPCDSWNMSSIPKKIYQRVGNLFQIKSIALLHCLDTLIFSRIMDLFCDQQNAWNCSQRIPISVAFVRTVLVYSLGRVNYLFFANCIFTKLGSPQAAQPCISM